MLSTPRAALRANRSAVPSANNFDLLRFAFAATVFFYHVHVLSDAPGLAALGMLSAELAVKSFFVVSGFLVFMSFESSRSTGDYFGKRIRRIYPAYVTVVVGAAVLGLFATELPLSGYLSMDLVRYLAANLAFLNFLALNLPGVFAHNSVTEVNGALWTIKVEVMFYASVPVLAWLARCHGRLLVLGAAYAFGVAWALGFAALAAKTGSTLYAKLSYQFPGQLAYFVAGALCYYYLPFLQHRWVAIASVGVLGMLIARAVPTTQVFVEPAALALVVTFFAVGVKYLGNFGRYGDFSYGTYILHVPIIQTLVAAGVFAATAGGGLALAAAIVLAAAFLCWHFVEKPFLKRGSHYVRANTGLYAARAPTG